MREMLVYGTVPRREGDSVPPPTWVPNHRSHRRQQGIFRKLESNTRQTCNSKSKTPPETPILLLDQSKQTLGERSTPSPRILTLLPRLDAEFREALPKY